MSIASQLPLRLRDPRWRPVKDMTGVKEALDIEAEDVEMLIDLGFVIAFNIALAVNGRRELRFLTSSVDHYRATLGNRPFEITMDETIRQLLHHDKPIVTGTEIDTALNCDPDHRQNLIRAEELKKVEGTSWKAGPGGSPIVTRESFVAFITRRRL